MGANPDDIEEADSAPPPPGTNKVEITVAGHTVAIESADPLADVVGYAMGLFEQTGQAAKNIPFGFGAAGGQFERTEPYAEPSGMESWEGDDARRLGRYQRHGPQDGAACRLGVPDPPGHHRARFRPVPLDREQRPLP
jgi:hypothetical protein